MRCFVNYIDGERKGDDAMKKNLIIILLVVIAGIGLSYVNEQVRKDRCYELPPKDFYNNKTCQKYVKEYEDD